MEKPVNIPLTQIYSSNIKAVGYDPATKTLRVKFNTNKIYDYMNLSPEEFEAFMDAPSKGSYFHQFIKGKKQFKTV